MFTESVTKDLNRFHFILTQKGIDSEMLSQILFYFFHEKQACMLKKKKKNCESAKTDSSLD